MRFSGKLLQIKDGWLSLMSHFSTILDFITLSLLYPEYKFAMQKTHICV